MKRGFTILELLVASLLLGMLVTILTMIFNQSSIAWRTGVAGVSRMDEVRDDVAEIREEADNLFFYSNNVSRITSLWDKDGNLRKRAYSVNGQEDIDSDELVLLGQQISTPVSQKNLPLSFSLNTGASDGFKSYTIGITSWGPDGRKYTYDDVTSWPDIIE